MGNTIGRLGPAKRVRRSDAQSHGPAAPKDGGPGALGAILVAAIVGAVIWAAVIYALVVVLR